MKRTTCGILFLVVATMEACSSSPLGSGSEAVSTHVQPEAANVSLGASPNPEPARLTDSTALAPGVRREVDGTFTKSACSDLPSGVHCHARVRTDAAGNVVRAEGKEGLGAGNWGADDLERAYAIPRDYSRGTTIAVLSMGDYSNAESDMAAYRAEYGLPPCTSRSGCFTKINTNGQTSPLPGASGADGEIMTDLAAVSAGCPDCRIILAEANADWSGAAGALSHAVARGAQVITISYLWGEPSSDSGDSWLNFPGVSTFVASGDCGFEDPNCPGYPATSAFVTAVGGTLLKSAPATSRGFSEVGWTTVSGAWGASNSFCSNVIPKPSWQGNTGCSMRATADVSAVALGYVLYWGGWTAGSGTSFAAPLVAGIYAETQLAGAGPSFSYAVPGRFNDITAGLDDNSNGFFDSTGVRASCSGAPICTVGTGWDGPTGNGTPNGRLLAQNYWIKTYQNSFEGNPGTSGSNASKWWFAGNAGIDVNAGFAIPGEQNDGWANSVSGWNAVNTWLYTTPGAACDVSLWVRTSQNNFGNGYIAVNNEANSQTLGGTGEFGVLPGDPNFAGYSRVNFSFTATDSQEIFFAGFWGNGQDSWMQVDDLQMFCRPQLTAVDITNYQTGVGFYVSGKGVSNGAVQLWYHGIPGQTGWRAGASVQSANNQFSVSDSTWESSNVACTQDQAAGTVNVVAIDSAQNQSTIATLPACNFCTSVIGQSSGGCQ